MDRWTIDELATKYVLSAGRGQDLYVEGVFDARLLNWFSEQAGLGLRAYPIDVVHIQDEVVRSHGLSTGSNRSRVVALARELRARVGNLSAKFLVDRDLEDFVPTPGGLEGVQVTTFGALDVHLFDPLVVEKICQVCAGSDRERAAVNRLDTIDAAHEVYLVRVALAVAQLNCGLLPITRDLALVGGRLQFDARRYLEGVMDKCRNRGALEAIEAEIKKIRAICEAGITKEKYVNAHDLLSAFAFLMRSAGVKALSTEEGARDVLLTHADNRTLSRCEILSGFFANG